MSPFMMRNPPTMTTITDILERTKSIEAMKVPIDL